MPNFSNTKAIGAWATPSSRGTVTYETVLYADGRWSCNCQGWCTLKKGCTDDQRTCKHGKDLAGEFAATLQKFQLGAVSEVPWIAPVAVKTMDLTPAGPKKARLLSRPIAPPQ